MKNKSKENKFTNEQLFAELKERGFYVSKIVQDEELETGYLIVSAESPKVKEVIWTERQDWSNTSTRDSLT